MRNVVKQYYFEFAKRMNQWLESEYEAEDLKEMWHKLLIVKQHGDSLHDSARPLNVQVGTSLISSRGSS